MAVRDLLVTASDAWQYALAVFLILTAIGLVIVLLRLSGTLQRINLALDGVFGEVVPMLGKVSVSLDHVNDELEKVGHITDSAVDATDKVDSAGARRVGRGCASRARPRPGSPTACRMRLRRSGPSATAAAAFCEAAAPRRRRRLGGRRPLPARPGDRRAGGASAGRCHHGHAAPAVARPRDDPRRSAHRRRGGCGRAAQQEIDEELRPSSVRRSRPADQSAMRAISSRRSTSRFGSPLNLSS